LLPSNLKDFPALARPHVLEQRSFLVKLVPRRLTDWQHLGKDERWDIVLRVIAPSVMRSDECFLYPDPAGSEETLFALASEILITDGKRFKIDLSRECFDEAYRNFWIDWDWSRGSIVWIQTIDEKSAASLFAHCFDPIAIENPTVYLGKNAVTLSKRRASKSDKVCFATSNGVEQLFVFGSDDGIGAVYDLALENCQFTEEFQASYGTK